MVLKYNAMTKKKQRELEVRFLMQKKLDNFFYFVMVILFSI